MTDVVFTEADILALDTEYQRRSEESFESFRRGLVVATAHGPQLYESIASDFQELAFHEIQPNIEALRDGKVPEKPRWWFERTKKASKDADLGVIILWLMAFPKRPFYCQIGAADTEQAGIVKDRISVLIHHNQWLNDRVEIIRNEIRSKETMINGAPMAHAKIMSSDIGGSHGGTPDLLVMNELSHISQWEFAENMMANAAGVPTGMVIVATNAGIKGTGAWQWRENAIANPDLWAVHIVNYPAPWHSERFVEDEKGRMPRSKFRRLWLGEWSSGTGDALSEEKIDIAFPSTAKEILHVPKSATVLIGMDLGVSRDHAGLFALEVDSEKRKLRALSWRRFRPPEGGEIQLMEVEDEARRMADRYGALALLYDPHQAKLMAQRLEVAVRCIEMTFSSAKNLTEMAMCMMEAFESEILELFDDEEQTLRSDLGKLRIVEKSYGFKLEATRDATGHADVATALMILLPTAIELLKDSSAFLPGDELIEIADKDLTEDEREALPEEFKELFDLEEKELEKKESTFKDDWDW